MTTTIYNGTDLSGPCFDYDAVVAAQLPLFAASAFPSPLLFCKSLPFYMEVPLIRAVGPGCNGVSACWASSQFLGFTEAEGPLLTELNNRIVGTASPSAAVYAFERQSGVDAQSVSAILLTVLQPGGSVGYVTMSPAALPALTNAGQFYATQVVTAAAARDAGVKWGVLGVPGTPNCVLMYSDAHVDTAPLTQMFTWGNTLYFSSGSVSQGSTGTHTAYHGVTTIANPGVPTANILYSPALTILPGQIPPFSASDIDSGVLNVQWTLKALPLSALSARVYMDTYCSSSVCNGSRAVLLRPSANCAAMSAMFPDILKAKARLSCGASASPAASPQPGKHALVVNTQRQKVLMCISLFELALFLILLMVLYIVLVGGKKGAPRATRATAASVTA